MTACCILLMQHAVILLVQQTESTTREAEAVIRVFEFWRDAGAGRGARHLNMVAPRPAARSLAAAALRALRIAVRRNGIVSGVIPVGTPFVDVVAQVVEAISVRRVKSNLLGAILPARSVIGQF